MNHNDPSGARSPSAIPRRLWLQGAAALAAGGLGGLAPGAAGAADAQKDAKPLERAATRGRIRQSLVYWCFRKHWDLETACTIAKQLGIQSIELVPPEDWPTLKKHGLACAIAGSHGFVQGMNDLAHHAMCIQKLRGAIDASAAHGVPNVITFTGMREKIPDDAGIRNCVRGFKEIIGHAEKAGVNLCLEMLNSRVDAEMKGHPGYQGDHLDYCMEIVRGVGSPRMKLLFDIYHVQIMDGDIIVRLRQLKDWIGHYHTAGNPGRRELDDKQEIQYKAVMEAIVETGYTGFVGQEFIPTRDPLEGLIEAVRVCDV
jgi:hydroxypyruvate isomerase